MMKQRLIAFFLVLVALWCGGCNLQRGEETTRETFTGNVELPDLGDFDQSFGEDLKDTPLYDGYFSDRLKEIEVSRVSGSQNAYRIEGNTLTFTSLSEDSVYSVSGKFYGNIVIDVGDEYRFDLEMDGLSLVSDSAPPVTVLSGDRVSLTAKKESANYIYDQRALPDEADESTVSSAVYSQVDLEICGKGELFVVSASGKGIHSKDDLEVKNLTLTVKCTDNALKGNDSITVESGTTTLIATKGDGMKTENSDISEKGNQRGTVSILGGSHVIYAACDGIDAAYDVVVDGSETRLNVYTDRYSNYSEEVTAISENLYYVRFSSNLYQYAVKYTAATDGSADLWVNAVYHSTVSGGRTNYYYYSFPKDPRYGKMQLFIYSSDQTQGSETDYLAATEALTLSDAYDTFALTSRGSYLSFSWTNYTTKVEESGMGGRPGGMGGGPGGMGGGPGGMQDGNTDKGDHSTKGIKSANEIRILNGTVTVKAYDDALHANLDATLENGKSPTGRVTLSGGSVYLYSNDDGVHADGELTVQGGLLFVQNSYEGLEGSVVSLEGGSVAVFSKDDGINSTATSGTGVSVTGGLLYVYAGGDGLDANSRSSYAGISFSGGKVVVVSTSGGNSAIDTENGYSFTGGLVLAIMPSGGMTSEATHCQNFSKVGVQKSLSFSKDQFVLVEEGTKTVLGVKMPASLSGRVIVLSEKTASVSVENAFSLPLDDNGVYWEG